MSYWNHRVLKRTYKPTLTDRTPHIEFGIHEVYYNDKNEIEMWTEDQMAPRGQTLEELAKDLQWFVDALKKPVLDEEELERANWQRSYDEAVSEDAARTAGTYVEDELEVLEEILTADELRQDEKNSL